MYRNQFWIEWNNSLDSEYQNDYKMSTCININAKIKIIHQVSLKIIEEGSMVLPFLECIDIFQRRARYKNTR